MDLTGLSGLSTALAQAQTQDAAALLVQRKTMEIASQMATDLLQGVSPAASNPPHLGQSIDVKA